MHVVKPDFRELRNFGLSLGTLFAAIFGGIPLLRYHATPMWPWILAMALWVAALLVPPPLAYLHRGWMLLGAVLGRINTRLILSILYLIVVVPIALVIRLAGRDSMMRKFDRTLDS